MTGKGTHSPGQKQWRYVRIGFCGGISKAGLGKRAGDKTFEELTRSTTAFGQERTVATQTVSPLSHDGHCLGKIRILLSFVVLPGERNSIILGQETLREVPSTDFMADLRRRVMALSGDKRMLGFEQEKSWAKVDEASTGLEKVKRGVSNPITSVGEVHYTRQAVQPTMAAYEPLERNVSVADMEE